MQRIINGLEYKPFEWQEFKIKDNNNCYTYAFDMMTNPRTGKVRRNWDYCQPAMLSKGRPIDANYCSDRALIKAVKEDMEVIGVDFEKFNPKKYYSSDWWKVALFRDYKRGENSDKNYQGDYHWYRQNLDGTWSQKVGGKEVTSYDKSGRIITDPVTCDRGSGDERYKYFVGFFMARRTEEYYNFTNTERKVC